MFGHQRKTDVILSFCAITDSKWNCYTSQWHTLISGKSPEMFFSYFSSCRLKGVPFLVGFLAPVVIILLGNTIAFIAIFRSLLASGSKATADRKATGLQQAKRAAAILSVLGLTWLFGVLAIKDAKLVFQYFFCIFNSIQGVLVFLFYCAFSVETRAKYKRFLFGKGAQASYSPPRGSSLNSRFRQATMIKSPGSNSTSTGTLSSSTFPPHDKDVPLDAVTTTNM